MDLISDPAGAHFGLGLVTFSGLRRYDVFGGAVSEKGLVFNIRWFDITK